MLSMAKYQILKYEDGYLPGMLIPYFWPWGWKKFPTFELALEELNNHIKAMGEQKSRNKIEVVYEVEV